MTLKNNITLTELAPLDVVDRISSAKEELKEIT